MAFRLSTTIPGGFTAEYWKLETIRIEIIKTEEGRFEWLTASFVLYKNRAERDAENPTGVYRESRFLLDGLVFADNLKKSVYTMCSALPEWTGAVEI